MAAGRPRTFDLDEALDRALNVFWRKGFEGTSLPDLTEAMQINRPSLYAAFGNKEQLFLKVLERYAERSAARIRSALEEPSIRGAIEKLLRGSIDLYTQPDSPPGCFMVQASLVCGEAGVALKSDLAKRRALFTLLLRKRFAQAAREGELPAGASAEDWARFIAAVSHGISVEASSGATRAQLLRLVQLALQGLPKTAARRR